MTEPPSAPDLVNVANVRAEVSAAFEAYDEALLSNDLDALDQWFWSSEQAVRFGLDEELHGAAAIARYRRGRSAPPRRGAVAHKAITTFGADAASVVIEFDDPSGARGRQSQSWIRFAVGWRIVAAHVSIRPR